MQSEFIKATIEENLEKLIINYDPITISLNDVNKALYIACHKGYLDIMKWLLIEGADIHHENEKCFITACSSGKINIVKYLIENDFAINIHANNEKAFKDSYYNGHLEIIELLMSLNDKPYIHDNNDEAFSFVCVQGHLDIAHFLYSLDDKPNIRAHDDKAFIYACQGGHIEFAKWLTTLCDDYIIDDINNNIIEYHITNKYEKKLMNRIKKIEQDVEELKNIINKLNIKDSTIFI